MNEMTKLRQTIPSGNDIHAATATIISGGVVIYPTETVYGLGADAFNTAAVQRISAIKKRDTSRPISIAVSDLNMLADAAYLDDVSEVFVRKFLPGPITVILPKKEKIPDILTGGSDLIGIRFPDHPLTIRLIQSVGGPITSTSANTSGRPAPSKIENIEPEIINQVDYIIEGRDCAQGAPSTVVDLVHRKILRDGALSSAVRKALEVME